MGNPVKPDAEKKKQTILWETDDWDRIERAAQVIADREHVECSPLNLIRGATMRRVEEILAATLAA